MTTNLLVCHHLLHLRKKNKETMRNWQACHHLLHLRKKLKDDEESRASWLIVIFYIWRKQPRVDDKSRGSSSTSALEKKTKKWWWASWLVVIFYTWGKKPKDICRIPCSFPTFFNSWRKPNKCKLLWLYCGVLATA